MFKNCVGVLLVAAVVPVAAFADDYSSRFSGGLKLGLFAVDSGAASGFERASGLNVDIDNGFGFGLHGDYKVTDNWYVDVEYLSTSLDVSFDDGTAKMTSSIDVSSFAVYGAYRSTGQMYYMGKLGLLSEDVSGNGVDENKVGLSFSVGGGYVIQDNFSIEAEFTSVEEDVAFIGLTARYTFK